MKINRFMIKKGIQCLKKYGVKELLIRTTEKLHSDAGKYDEWFQKQRLTDAGWEEQRAASDAWTTRPVVSICVPIYQTPETYFCQMIDSVRNQTYTNWQLCLADGSPGEELGELLKRKYPDEKRICYRHLEQNLGISENTNAALALAEGEWIALLDHDDVLAPDALYEVLMAAKTGTVEEAGAVYTDEDKITEDLKTHFDPHFKPDYNPDLLCSNNYITHFFAVKREIAKQAGGFRGEFDGSQDHDFIFRCTDIAENVAHVPKILYHWRTSANSTAENPESKMYAYDAGKRAIEAHLKAKNIKAGVEYTKKLGFFRVKYEVQGEPLISVIVVGDHTPRNIEKSSYQHYEVFHTAAEKEVVDRCIRTEAKGEYIVLVDGNTEICTENWLEEMAGLCQRADVAAVGAKIFQPSGKIQSAGQVMGGPELVNDLFKNMPGDHYGYMQRACLQIGYTAVSMECVMLKRCIYEELGGLQENNCLGLSACMLDYYLRLQKAGYRTVYTPYAGVKMTAAEELTKMEEAEKKLLLQKWPQLKMPDPNYHPDLSLQPADYKIKHNDSETT